MLNLADWSTFYGCRFLTNPGSIKKNIFLEIQLFRVKLIPWRRILGPDPIVRPVDIRQTSFSIPLRAERTSSRKIFTNSCFDSSIACSALTLTLLNVISESLLPSPLQHDKNFKSGNMNINVLVFHNSLSR